MSQLNFVAPRMSSSATRSESGSGLFGSSKPAVASQKPVFAVSLFGTASTPSLKEEPAAQSSTNPLDELRGSLKRLFTSGSYSDLVIKCGDDLYKVHRAIICPRSAFFEAACNGRFKEAETGEIDLTNDDPSAVKMMVHYFYHLDYSFITALTTTKSQSATPFGSSWGHPKQPQNLILHAKVYALGEKYDVKGLKTLAVKKFNKEAEDHWDSDDFLVAVQEVYTSTADHDRPMRDAVLNILDKHLILLEKESVREVINGLDLSSDLLMHLAKEVRSRRDT